MFGRTTVTPGCYHYIIMANTRSKSLLLSVEDEDTFGDLQEQDTGKPKINETANVDEDTESPNSTVRLNPIMKVYDRKIHSSSSGYSRTAVSKK